MKDAAPRALSVALTHPRPGRLRPSRLLSLRPCKGKPAAVQELARFIASEPNHRGVAKLLRRLHELRQSDPAVSAIEVDCHREFWEAIRIGELDSVDSGLAEITHQRTYLCPQPQAISNIHKTKGLECNALILMPCDAKSFPDTPETRGLLYVAFSRAMKSAARGVAGEPEPVIQILTPQKPYPRIETDKRIRHGNRGAGPTNHLSGADHK